MKLSEERLEEIRLLTWEWKYENCEDHQRAVDDLLLALEAKSKALDMMAESVADGLSHITTLKAELEEAHRVSGQMAKAGAELQARLNAARKALRDIRRWVLSDHHPDIALAKIDSIARVALAATEEGKPEGGAALIAAERKRQITEEGWTPEHDRQWWASELARAAATYAMPPSLRLHLLEIGPDPYVPSSWPWAREWWKPGDRIRELTKAGALIAAEMDRLAVLAATEEGK